MPTSYCLAQNGKQVSLPTLFCTGTWLVCRATSEPGHVCAAPCGECYVGAYMHCCYLQHCCQVSVWNTAFDLVGRADTEWYIWINPVLLTLSQARSLRQELTQGKILSQTSWSCSISMNLQLRFSNQGEEASIVSVVSSFIYLFMHFPQGMKHLFLLCGKYHPKLVHISDAGCSP